MRLSFSLSFSLWQTPSLCACACMPVSSFFWHFIQNQISPESNSHPSCAAQQRRSVSHLQNLTNQRFRYSLNIPSLSFPHQSTQWYKDLTLLRELYCESTLCAQCFANIFDQEGSLPVTLSVHLEGSEEAPLTSKLWDDRVSAADLASGPVSCLCSFVQKNECGCSRCMLTFSLMLLLACFTSTRAVSQLAVSLGAVYRAPSASWPKP